MTLAQAEGRPFFDWAWVGDHLADIGTRVGQHLQLTFIAVLVGLLISFPLSIFAYRHRRFLPPITIATGILYTIPSLALFALLIPFTKLSVLTAEIGLVSYTLLILIRNIVAGLEGIPSDVKEAAVGMGYSPRELFWRVELPLAIPVIAAGVRVATVTTIGLVTVAALIGKGGVGYFILLGFDRSFPTASMLGALLSLILAVSIDGLLVVGERLVTPWAHPHSARSAG